MARKHRLLQRQCWTNLPTPEPRLVIPNDLAVLPPELSRDIAQNCHSCGKRLPAVLGIVYCPYCATMLAPQQPPQKKRRRH